MTNKKAGKRSSNEGVNVLVKTGKPQDSVDLQNKKAKVEKSALQNGKNRKAVKGKSVGFDKGVCRNNRKVARKSKGQYKVDNIHFSVDELKAKIKAIQGKGMLSKTARRKLGIYQKKLAIKMGVDLATVKVAGKKQPEQPKKKNQEQTKKPSVVAVTKLEPGSMIRVQSNQNAKNRNENTAATKGKKEEEKGQKLKAKAEESEEEEDDDDDDEDDDDDDDDEEVDLAGENDEDEDDDDSDEDDDDDEEEEEEEEDDDDSNEDEDALKSTSPVTAAKKGEPNTKNTGKQDPKKKRYVLFVGNLPYDVTTDELKSHFLTKASEVVSVRLSPKPGTNQPRGIAYVEFSNDIDYEKALSLHHSFVKGRRINVQYTAGSPNSPGQKAQMVAKNQKLHALRQAGKLAGSSRRGGGARFTPMGGRPKQR